MADRYIHKLTGRVVTLHDGRRLGDDWARHVEVQAVPEPPAVPESESGDGES